MGDRVLRLVAATPVCGASTLGHALERPQPPWTRTLSPAICVVRTKAWAVAVLPARYFITVGLFYVNSPSSVFALIKRPWTIVYWSCRDVGYNPRFRLD